MALDEVPPRTVAEHSPYLLAGLARATTFAPSRDSEDCRYGGPCMGRRGTGQAEAIREAVAELDARRAGRAVRVPIDALAQVPLFAGLSRRHLRKLSAAIDEVHYRDGRSAFVKVVSNKPTIALGIMAVLAGVFDEVLPNE
jgi:hypothetical protein